MHKPSAPSTNLAIMSDRQESQSHHHPFPDPQNDSSAGASSGSAASRDARIAHLERLLSSTTAEMSELRTLSAERECRCRLENDELRRENGVLAARLAQMENDMDDKKALHEYAKMIVEAGGEFGQHDSAYVVRLQSKLCKAIHQRAVWSEQMALLKESCQRVVECLQEDVVDAVNEKCKAEVEAMNAIVVAEKHRCQMVVECEDKIEEVRAEYEERLLEAQQKNTMQQGEIERLEAHLEMEKETRSSLVSVCMQQQQVQQGKDGDEPSDSSLQRRKEQGERLDRLMEKLRVATTDNSSFVEDHSLKKNVRTPNGKGNGPQPPISNQMSAPALKRTGSMLSQLRSNLVRSQSLWSVKESEEDTRAQEEGTESAVGVNSHSLSDVTEFSGVNDQTPQSASYSDKMQEASGGRLSMSFLLNPGSGEASKKELGAKTA